MRPASPALVALLASGERFMMADLYSLTLVGGGVFRYSAAMTAVTDAATGRVFQLGPKFERSKTKTVIGVQVDELDINIYPDETDLLGGTLFLKAAWQGQLDGALVQLERAFFGAAGWGDTTPGTIVLFSGKVSDLDCSRTGIDMKCRSHLELLNIQMPRRLWQASCTHVFGGPMCQFDRQSLALTFDCAAGSTTTAIQGAPLTTTPFQLGTIVATAGANAGQSRTIRAFQSGGAIAVTLPFLSAPAAGDQFQILPGCDHTLTGGCTFFNNTAHFGGFPFIPVPELAV